MRKVKVLALLLMLFSLMPIGFSKADWEYQDSYGSWDYYSADNWKSPYDANYSWFEYRFEQNNLSKFGFAIRLKNYVIGGLWELEKAQQLVNITLIDANETHKLQILISHELRIHLFGYTDVLTQVLVTFDDKNQIVIPLLNNMDVEVWIWRSGTDQLSADYMLKFDCYSDECQYIEKANYTVGSSWFENVTIIQRVEKQLYTFGYCNAMIEGEKLKEVISSGGVLSEAPYNVEELPLAEVIARRVWGYLKSVSDKIYEALPENVQNFISTASTIIYDFGDFAYSLLIALWNTLIPNIPLIFGAYGLYLIYLVFKSIDEGDFSPLFEHFMKITSLFLALANTVLSVIRTIINSIKWW